MNRCPDARCRIRIFTLAVLVSVLLTVPAHQLPAYNIIYAEQYYRLYHQNFYQYPEDYRENIWYLERALERPFVNPLNALAVIENRSEWERYRYLFAMHVNLELVKQYRRWGAEYDKREAYFFNQPWKEQNLESLEKAQRHYETALHYWNRALTWWARAEQTAYHHLEEIQHWEDERHRITEGELDYADIIGRDLARVARVRERFAAMDEQTY